MSLRDHMPYGAPDLIAVREEHTWRSTMLAAALAVATLGVAHAIVTLLPRSEPSPPAVSRCWCDTQTPGTYVPVADMYVPVAKVSYGMDGWVAVLPVAVHQAKPVYPSVARRAGVEGRVVVRVLIGTNGRVLEAQVGKSVPVLDRSALTAARQWVFTPALDGSGHQVPCWVAIPFVFRLH